MNQYLNAWVFFTLQLLFTGAVYGKIMYSKVVESSLGFLAMYNLLYYFAHIVRHIGINVTMTNANRALIFPHGHPFPKYFVTEKRIKIIIYSKKANVSKYQ